MERKSQVQKIVEICKSHKWCRDCSLVGADGMCLMDINPLHWDWEEIDRRLKKGEKKKDGE